jgi:queuosine precursor transporter
MSNEVILLSQALMGFGLILCALRFGGPLHLKIIAVAATLLMNIFVLKQFTVFGLEITGGNVCYAMVFLCTDAISELYGPKAARKLVILGFLASTLMVLFSQFILAYQPNSFDFAHDALNTIFSFSPRIVFFSLLSYLIAQNISIALFHRIKRATQGRMLWLRNNISTLVGQTFDTVFFTMTALYGVIDNLGEVMLFSLIVKLMLAALDTPFLYLARAIHKEDT